MKLNTMILAMLLSLLATPGFAEVPGFVPYSGRLADGTGWNASTELDLTIKIHSCKSGDDCLLFTQEFPATKVVNEYFPSNSAMIR